MRKVREGLARFYGFLDARLFPLIVAYATHRVVILMTILLIVPLVVFASVTWLALILGNYTNVVSAAVSSIVLLQSLRHHAETARNRADHAAAIAAMRLDHRSQFEALHQKVDALSGAKGAAR
jgi:hypothetical protein